MRATELHIREPGLQSTVQDTGRNGCQIYGVPVSGAMDGFALRVANLLVGNDDDNAALEITALGPKLSFGSPTWISVTGADLSPTIDGAPLPMWESVRVEDGSVLAFGPPRDGMRAYLAVAGGIDVPVVMGSRSTYLKGGFGGYEGRSLRTGDVVRCLDPGDREIVKRRLPSGIPVPIYGHNHELRVIMGPQDSAFTSDAVSTFLSSTYTISMDSDRMGYRMEGPPLEHVAGADIVSDGTTLGAIQVPGARSPIVLVADRGVTGGYAKIATVITADIGKLGQAMPGDTVAFRKVTIEEAHAAYREQEEYLETIAGPESEVLVGVTITVDGQMVQVVDADDESLLLDIPLRDHSDGDAHRVRATVSGQVYEFDVEIQRSGD